ncbi:MAG TPA: DUF5658 family protein [Mesotoga sp.]|nr:DUF5658 family protein [Mesotoga sp.]HRU78440.1 DUF5658 family protein [Rectinema sp.]
MVILILITAIMVLCVFDTITTEIALRLGGRELNPVMLWFMGKFGRWWWIPKLIGTIAVIIILMWLPSLVSEALGSAMVLMYVAIVVNNIRNIIQLKRQKEDKQ